MEIVADNVEIQGLEFQIKDDSEAASAGLEKLTDTLTRLKAATQGGASGLTSIAKQLEKLKNATSGIDNSAGARIKSFVSAIESTKKLSGVKISSTISKHLNTIREAAGSITSEHISNLNMLRDTLSGFTTIGKSNVGTMVNALAKLPSISEKLGTTDWKGFYSAIQRATRIVAPFAAEMEKIYNGFSVFPSKVQAFIKSSQKFNSSANKSTTVAERFSSVLSSLNFVAFAYGVRRVASAIGSAITLSNSYQENLNLFTVAMGKYADQAYEYGKRVSEVMGIDLSDWLYNQGIFNTLITGFGVVSDRAYTMSKNLTQLGYDLSSFFNISVTDAMEKLQSGISGELEPLRRLGYDLSDARLKATALSLGIDKATNSMTQAEKAELRYYAILNQVTTAQGDLSRTLDAPANQLRILKAQFTAAARAVGNIFIPALNAILPYAIAVVEGIRSVADAIASLFGFELTEVDYSGIGAAVGNVADGTDTVNSNLGDAAESAKKLQRYLLGFDELNILPDQSSGSGGAGGGSAGGGTSGSGFDFELPQYDFLTGAVNERLEQIKSKMQPFFDWVTGHLDDVFGIVTAIGTGMLGWKISSALIGALTDLSGLKKYAVISGITLVASGVILEITGIKSIITDGIDITGFVETLLGGAMITGGAALIGSAFGATVIATSIGAMIAGVPAFAAGLYSAITEGLNGLSATLIAAGSTATGAAIGAIIGSLGGPIGAGIGALIGLAVGAVTDLTILIVQNWDTVSQFFVDLWAGIVNTANGAWSSVQEWWGNTAEWWKTTVIDPVGEFFANLWDGISSAASTCVDAVIGFFTPIGEWFGELFSSIGQTVSDVFYNIGVIAGGCWEIVQTAWGIAADWFNRNVVTPVSTFFSNAWSEISNAAGTAWSNIKSTFGAFSSWFNSNVISPVSGFFSGLWGGVKSKASEAWNGIKSVFSQAGNFFRDTFQAAWKKVVGVFSTAGEIFVDIKNGILTGFKSIVNQIISGINRVVSVPFNGINSALRTIKNINILGITPFSSLRTISVPQIPMLAGGGFVDKGQLFVAREAGPELVGRIGNKTAVANQDQIVEAVADGVYRAVSKAQGDGQTDIYVDGEKLFEVVKRHNNRERMRTGKNPLLV